MQLPSSEKADTNVSEQSVLAAMHALLAEVAGWDRMAARAPEGQSARDEPPRRQQGWLAGGGRTYTGGAGVRRKAEAVRGGGERR